MNTAPHFYIAHVLKMIFGLYGWGRYRAVPKQVIKRLSKWPKMAVTEVGHEYGYAENAKMAHKVFPF